MIVTVYALFDTKTQQPFYVGATETDLKIRASGHYSSAKTSNVGVYKYIRNNKITFSVEPLDIIEIELKQEKYRWEGYWQQQIRSWGFKLWNKYYSSGLGVVDFRKNCFRVVEMYSNGHDTKTIAKELKVKMTMINHVTNVLKSRYGCKSVIQLIAYFLRNKLID